MATKTFKIGEYCVHGIITATTIGKSTDSIKIELKDYTTKKVMDSKVFTDARELDRFLNDATTYYFASKVQEWIESKGISLS